MEEPYLPPFEPTNNSVPNKKSGRRTLLLWAVLILMFIAVYNFFAVSPDPHAPPLPPCSTSYTSILTAWVPAVAIVALIIFFFWWQLRGSSTFNLSQEPGLTALAGGQLDKAAAAFRAVIAKYGSQSHYHSVARYSLAITLLRQGKLADAVGEAIVVEKGAGLLWASEIRLLAATLLGQLYALRGQTEAAERWVKDARKRLARSNSRMHAAAKLSLAEAVVLCRQGRFDEAARGLDRDWRQIEGNLVIPYLRTGWLMRAFAASQLGGPRGEGGAAPYLMMLRSQPPGSLDHLAVEWPELRTFLVANSLSSAA